MSGHHILIMPGAPALVAELAPEHEPSRRLAAAARRAAAGADVTGMEIACSLDERWRTGLTGSFAAWGAPHVNVGEGNHLPELVARRVLAGAHPVTGTRPSIGRLNPSALTVVVVDGPAGLTPRAPLSLVDGAPGAHAAIQSFLAGRGGLDVGTLGPAGVLEPSLWGELAALEPESARLLDTDDSLGVGAYVAVWEV